ncbi:MAG TPA: NAD(P)-binding protein [Ureibacillus sp.]|nr:NAD(P)-binding protein [Ureibacillus sp.]
MYPIALKLENKRVLIVGGGKVATQKATMLIKQNADVVVVSPTLTQTLHSYTLNNQIRWIERGFEKADTDGAFLVIAATDDRHVNDLVRNNCLENQLVNVVDSPEDSNFFNMAFLDRGKLKIAISTEGASPILAKQIKQDLNEFFDDGYEAYLNFLLAAREKIKQTVIDEEKKYFLLQQLLQDKFRSSEEARELFLSSIDDSV